VAVAAASAATVSATPAVLASLAFVTSSRLQTKSQFSTPPVYGLRRQARRRCNIWSLLAAVEVELLIEQVAAAVLEVISPALDFLSLPVLPTQ